MQKNPKWYAANATGGSSASWSTVPGEIPAVLLKTALISSAVMDLTSFTGSPKTAATLAKAGVVMGSRYSLVINSIILSLMAILVAEDAPFWDLTRLHSATLSVAAKTA